LLLTAASHSSQDFPILQEHASADLHNCTLYVITEIKQVDVSDGWMGSWGHDDIYQAEH
jgi:hypothetical protein